MHTTPPSLLEQVRRSDDIQAWRRFVDLYTPLLFHWARRVGLREPDAADLVQDIFVLLVKKLPDFQYDRNKGFRAWLRTVALKGCRWINGSKAAANRASSKCCGLAVRSPKGWRPPTSAD